MMVLVAISNKSCTRFLVSKISVIMHDHLLSGPLICSPVLISFVLRLNVPSYHFLVLFILNFIYARNTPLTLHRCYRWCDIFFCEAPYTSTSGTCWCGWYCLNLRGIYRCCLFTSISWLIYDSFSRKICI